MAILSLQTQQPTGLASVNPSVIYIQTNDTYATVTATGYLTSSKQEGFTYSNNQMALVYTTDEGPVWLKVVITYSDATIQNTVISLVQISSPGDVVLPTIANHLMVSTDTVGTLANLTGTAINNGSLQAGLSGTAGTLISYPSTASKGSLIVAAVANTGNTNVTISNAAMGQASVISIPDPGQTTSEFIIADSAGTQHITSGGLQADVGPISVGLSAGGANGEFIAYPNPTGGSLRLAAVAAGGAYNTVISNGTMGQSTTYTIPDAADAAGQFLVGATATPFTSGNFPVASGTAGLMVDSGLAASDIQNKTNIIAAQSADIGGAGAGPITVTQADVTTSSVIIANILSSSNAVAVAKVAPGTGNFDITFTGDPGAACVMSYVVFVAAQ